ncbi:MAG: hypothetical protein ACI8R9_000125 [Paraglaciecola sp.]
MEIIDPQTGEIQVLSNKVLPRRYFSAVWDGQHSIYLLGGISHIGDSIALEPTVEIFDTITHKITFATPVARHNSSAVYLDGQIYLFGGSDYSVANGFELIPSTLATRYDLTSQTWLPVADMLTAKATRVFAKDGMIYALGGARFMAPMTVFEQYNPRQNSWQKLPYLPLPISAHSLVVYGQKLRGFGSDDVPDLTYSYDFELATWQKTDIGYLPSSQNTATLLGNTIYVIGGTGGKGRAFVNSIQPFPQKWTLRVTVIDGSILIPNLRYQFARLGLLSHENGELALLDCVYRDRLAENTFYPSPLKPQHCWLISLPLSVTDVAAQVDVAELNWPIG